MKHFFINVSGSTKNREATITELGRTGMEAAPKFLGGSSCNGTFP